MGSSPVVFFEVLGDNGVKLREFYARLFGWSFNDIGGDYDYGMVSTDGQGIAGGIGTTPDGTPGRVTFYVSTDDIAGSLRRAESLGGSTVMAPMTLPSGGEIALLNDPEGHTIGLTRQP